MAKGRNSGTTKTQATHQNGATIAAPAVCRTLAVTERGIQSDADLIEYTTAMLCDLSNSTQSTAQANAGFKGVGMLLKYAELKYKYGKDKQSFRLLER